MPPELSMVWEKGTTRRKMDLFCQRHMLYEMHKITKQRATDKEMDLGRVIYACCWLVTYSINTVAWYCWYCKMHTETSSAFRRYLNWSILLKSASSERENLNEYHMWPHELINSEREKGKLLSWINLLLIMTINNNNSNNRKKNNDNKRSQQPYTPEGCVFRCVLHRLALPSHESEE